MSRPLAFTKMTGAGNDFLIVDATQRRVQLKTPWARVSRALCDRHLGVGADGLLVLEPSRGADVRMRIFNPDGSEAAMCGNGARCVARYVADGRAHANGYPVSIKTGAGVLSARVQGDRVAMRMPDPTEIRLGLRLRVGGRRVAADVINTGVPHAVVRVRRLNAVDIEGLGRALRRHRAFGPRGTNVNFLERDAHDPHRVRIRTYERGVEAETLACGTGVVAAAVIHALTQRRGARAGTCRMRVQTRSKDDLTVSMTLTARGGRIRVTDVVLEGPARRICEGTVSWSHHLRRIVDPPRRFQAAWRVGKPRSQWK